MKEIIQLVSISFILLALLAVHSCSSKKEPETKSENVIQFTGIRRIQSGDEWKVKEENTAWKAKEIAIIICDMWDEHWCKGATKRVGEMAPKINELVEAARKKGVSIIHAPSDVIDYYEGIPQRDKLKNVTITASASSIPGWYSLDSLKEAQLPIDDSDGGCDCSPKCTYRQAWKKQISAIRIDEKDGISDNGKEIVSYFQQKGVKNVIIMGVHTNMCVLGRSFGIRGQTAAGMNVVLVRDLTDAMYNHEMSPFVSHKEGTEKVIEHIEKYWSATVLSQELIQSLL